MAGQTESRLRPPELVVPTLKDGPSLEELRARIKPVKSYYSRDGDGSKIIVYLSQNGHPVKTSFSFLDKPVEIADDLVVIKDITTTHSYGAPSLFKPSEAEVLAQIPQDVLDTVVAYEVDSIGRIEVNEGHHTTTTTLYGRLQKTSPPATS